MGLAVPQTRQHRRQAHATWWQGLATTGDAGAIELEGQLDAGGGQTRLQVSRASLELAAPYLGRWLKPRLEGHLSLLAEARWRGPPGAQLPDITLARATLEQFKLRDTNAGASEVVVQWPMLELTQVQVDSMARRLSLGRVRLTSPSLALTRDTSGNFSPQAWWVAPVGSGPSPAVSPPASPPPWRLEVREAQVDGGKLRWRDQAAGRDEVVIDLTALNLATEGMLWPAVAKVPMKLQGSARVGAVQTGQGAVGRLSWAGQLDLARASGQGQLRAERMPLHVLMPYVGADLPVTLAHADADWDGQVLVNMASNGLTWQVSGDARLSDWHVQARSSEATSAEDLLSWKAMTLGAVKASQAPGRKPRIDIGEVTLADAYAQLLITEKGQLNLTGLAPPAAGTPAEAAAPAASVPASAPAAVELPVDIAVGGVKLLNGKVDFTDRFIRPNYSADLTELNGSLGAFRSDQPDMARLALRGKVAGTAQLEVQGSLLPTARPIALDIQAKATDLELTPLSPYAAKYAGYAIERGKLSMDVTYRIQPDGRLEARNQIVLNQLTFGERIDSPEATRLPVLLAVALLKDRNGVIDLDLPIGGSINDPEFSLGGLVIKVIVNVLTKALTAPFALLSGGGTSDLSVVEFLPGTADLAPASAAQIDKVAQALADRPALKLTVAGQADPQREREAVQAAWLNRRLQAEQRKALARDGEPSDAALPSLSAAERAQLLARVYADTKIANKPRNMVGLAKDIAPAEMEALLKASHTVTPESVRELADQRGMAVRDALLSRGLANGRIFLGASKLQPGADAVATGAQLTLGKPVGMFAGRGRTSPRPAIMGRTRGQPSDSRRLTMAITETITLAGGCFWCLEAVFEQIKGVESVQSGYANGHGEHPSYAQVCGGDTGHAEVVQLSFDPDQVSLRELLEVFFVIHDPTTLNRQGHDIGTQYRSGIYWHGPAQAEVARAVLSEVVAAHPGKVVTELQPLEAFWPAEPEHHRYFARHPGQGYCALVVAPKVEKFRQTFQQLSRT